MGELPVGGKLLGEVPVRREFVGENPVGTKLGGEIPSHRITTRGEFQCIWKKLRGEVPWVVKEILVKSRGWAGFVGEVPVGDADSRS